MSSTVCTRRCRGCRPAAWTCSPASTTSAARELGARDTTELIAIRHRLDPAVVRRDLKHATALHRYPTVTANLPDPSDPLHASDRADLDETADPDRTADPDGVAGGAGVADPDGTIAAAVATGVAATAGGT